MSSIALFPERTPATRNLWIAVALSLTIHFLVLTLAPRPRYDEVGPRRDDVPLRVEIVTQAVAPPSVETPPAPVTRPEPVRRPPPRGERRPTPPAAVPPPPRPTPPPIAVPLPSPTPAPPPQVAQPSRPAPAFDMSALIAQRQEQRRAAEAAMARGTPEAKEPAQDEALASINRNLQTLSGREGVGGIFQILHMGTRTGEFAFNGWRPESRRQWREVIEVDAGPGGNLELAMVRRMIELIRTHYQGDFNWESHRLQRTVVLSARQEDSAELEDFLMREFFGTPLAKPHG